MSEQLGDVLPGVSSAVVRLTSWQVGASLTGGDRDREDCVALSSTPPLAVPPLSVIFRVIVAEPKAFAAGV